MKSYPYIGEDKSNGNITLFTGENEGLVIKNKIYALGYYHSNWNELSFENTTADHLDNTYGLLEGKKHTDFVIKLATNHGYKVDSECDNPEVFEFNGNKIQLYKKKLIGFVIKPETKRITIPLPPECDGVEINNDNEFEFVDCAFKGIKINTKSECPKVGDDVVLMSGKGKVVALPDNHGNYVIVTDKGFYLLANKNEIKKPKTPEQIMQENLINIYESSLDGGHFVDNLLSEYTLIKKPQ